MRRNPDAVKMLVDTDTGIDDAMAILYGLQVPEIDIVAFTTVWGNADIEPCTLNTLRLLEMTGDTHIPVAKGAGKPLLGPLTHISTDVHGMDGIGNVNLPPPTIKVIDENATQLIIRMARENPGELTLLALGPLTNVAAALLAAPEIAKLYKEIVIMGGVFNETGNVSRVGGANGWHDPEAVQIVYEADWKILTVGINVTHKVLLSQEQLDEARDSGAPTAVFLHQICDFYFSRYVRTFGRRVCAMHDPLAIAIAADRSLITRSEHRRADMELGGTHTRGMTVGDFRPWADPALANVEIVFECDQDRFLKRWLDVISGKPVT